MRDDHSSGGNIYDALQRIDQAFAEVLGQIERLKQIPWFRKKARIKPAERAVQEARAWTLFEILEVLHEREEEAWFHLGRARVHREQKSDKPRRTPQ